MTVNTPILDRIDSPADLRLLDHEQLEQLSGEIRQRILAVASEGGGHLAPHLGVVELSIALHYIYDTPRDLLLWDVGHQCYAHKLLTGRRDALNTIRRRGGLSGYPRRSESAYDPFGVGHSSTSISAALGMAAAAAHQNQDKRCIAVIGDGAMTAGMAFEAMAHAGYLEKNLLVILNDNKMSISPNVGAMSAYLSRLITNGLYNRAKGDFKKMLPESFHSTARKMENALKGLLVPGTMFEALGLKYVGPVDGHCVHTLVECLDNIKELEGPVLFHVVTQKGKGYEPAEQDPLTYHGVKPFDRGTGVFMATGNGNEQKPKTFTDAFAETLIEEGAKDERIAAITAAMPTGTGLSKVEQALPGRVYDVGICEQHAVTFAAGLACEGMKPVCAIYSTFLQRGYDQAIHDVCLQDLPVLFAIDRAGAVGEDSPTQQGAFDISFLRCVPNIRILAPRDEIDTRRMIRYALAQDGPVAVRYARGAAPNIGAGEGERLSIERGEWLRHGEDAAILVLGPVAANCLEAAERLAQEEGFDVGVADARWAKPLDTLLMNEAAGKPIITVEENSIVGGFGSAVLEYLAETNQLADTRVKRLGFPDAFVPHATRAEQLEDIGLGVEGIFESVRGFLGQEIPQAV